MRNSYTDSNGNLRYEPDSRHQFLLGMRSDDLDPWTSYDSWDVGLAIRLITIGYNIDIAACLDESSEWPEGASGKDAARSYRLVYERGLAIANSSVAAKVLSNPDTPANWLEWAKRKGYDVSHLDGASSVRSKTGAQSTPRALTPEQVKAIATAFSVDKISVLKLSKTYLVSRRTIDAALVEYRLKSKKLKKPGRW